MVAEPQDAQKRKLDEEGGGDAKRAAAGGAAPMEVDGAMVMRNEDFSPQLLRIYYDRLFPFLQMFRWLSYRNDPKSSSAAVQKDFFLRREFTFVLQGDIYCRYQCFKDAEEYKAKVMAQQPVRMEIGAVYTHPPKHHNTVIKDAYKPVERELVFDIDMDDYDEIRTCCTGATLCPKCWTFMKAAIQILRRALTEDFGFQHLLFVYSGRRGVHCWVSDTVARKLNNEQRSAVAEYLTMVSSGAGKSRADLRMNGCEELHPAVQGAYDICKKWFRDDANGILASQDILRKGPHLANILEPMSIAEKETISKYVETHPQANSLEIWTQLEKIADERAQSAVTFKQKADAKMMLKDVVIQYTSPRLDINVSKQMNHLLKSPFVVHPKTGRVCVPIDPDHVNDFNPLEVPTVGRLIEELNKSGDIRETSLRPYTHFFEVNFLQKLEKATAEEMRSTAGVDFTDF
eukprot:CAMPEP_0115055820 /NCGR_PEP_ID=MMETSP0227-20121206/4859_1 /TAXON_ID=89957 /ORGANISM="Polarella glacialis, Strain CCMP 1383" /LENGTH=458 /DNA_ID=CAMNT_0002440443 /DNA_START=95 /DNA_END=1471 /DNA_ORIENTATION=-